MAAKIAEIDGLLNRTKGSLYEWLEENKRDWEQNIGKVVNEESVLYQTGLHPQKDDGTSLFGVKLDLIDLPLSVRKPTQLKEEHDELELKLRSLQTDKKALTEQQEKLINELKRRVAPKMRELREQKSYHETELRVIPQKQKALKLKQEDYAAKAQQEKEERAKLLNTRLQEVALRRTAADTNLDKIQAEKQKQLTAEDKRYQKAKDETIRLHEQRVAEIKADIKQQEKKAEEQLLLLQQQENEELRGRGADTRMVDECKNLIKATEDELKFIDDHRRIVFDFQRDRESLFNREDEFKAKKKLINDKLQQLNEKYNLRKQKHNEALASLGKELAERKDEKRLLDENLQKAENFAHDEKLCPPMLAEANERQTLRTPGQAVEELTGIIVSRQKSYDKLKAAVNLFKGNFTTKNTFNFRMELTLDDDYLDFANNLEDFLTYNKIEEFRRRTSERSVLHAAESELVGCRIVPRVAVEVFAAGLLRHGSREGVCFLIDVIIFLVLTHREIERCTIVTAEGVQTRLSVVCDLCQGREVLASHGDGKLLLGVHVHGHRRQKGCKQNFFHKLDFF